jgi:hypothetical protein
VGEAGRLRLTLRNTGADTWLAGVVALVGPGGQTIPLPRDVGPSDTVTLAWHTAPYAQCGIQREQWRLAENGQLFPGPGLSVSTIVLPEALAGERLRFTAQVSAWLRDDERGARPPFLAEVARLLRPTCDTAAAMGAFR